MDISKNRRVEFGPQLVQLLRTEVDESNRRQIVRALGHLALAEAAPVLVAMLASESGLMLGDLAEALGRLRVHEARSRLEELQQHPIDWVQNKTRWALRRLDTGGQSA